jgi:intein/homing endonuclease
MINAPDTLGQALRESVFGTNTLADRLRPAMLTVGAKVEEDAKPLLSDELRRVIGEGWGSAWSFLFDDAHRPFVANLERHHRASIRWHWATLHRLCRNEIIVREQLAASRQFNEKQTERIVRKWREKAVRYYADFPIFSRGHMKCVDADTEVLMADGTRKPIKAIIVGEFVQSLHEVTGAIVRRPVTKKWFQGDKECLRVTTRSGREFIATADHRVRSFDGWSTLAELEPGDRIASPRRSLAPVCDYRVSDEELRLLGYFIAEGNTTFSGVSFSANITNMDDVIVDDAIACAESLGFSAKRSLTAKYRVTFTGGIRPWLERQGFKGKKATEKRLPSWCFSLSERQSLVLLAAIIDTDGFISTQSAGVNLANEGLIDDLRQVFLQARILTKKYHLPRGKFESWVLEFDHHDLHAQLIRLPLRLKAQNIRALTDTRRYSLIDCYPSVVALGLSRKSKKGLNKAGIRWRASHNCKTLTRQKGARIAFHSPTVVWLEGADVFWDAIVSIEPAGIRPTYDIEVADTHNFIGNGLITHNSTIARRLAVMDAVIRLYYGLRGYCLYISGTDAKTGKHAISIEILLKSERIREHAPLLSEVNKSEEGGRSLGWKATFFYTAAGYVYHFGSLQSGLAGGNVDDVRPTLMVLDDIDDRKNSAVQAEANFNRLTDEILPMGAFGTLTFWAQNFINRYSCMYRIYKGHKRVLTDRRPSEPVPAVIGLKTELRKVGSIVREVIVAGEPTWKYFGLEACQNEINRMGLPAFMRECQHKVEQSTEGAMIHTYEDLVHAISQSEFASVFGTRDMPRQWPKQWVNDWARTKSAYHANVAFWQTVSPQDSKLPGLTFYWHSMSFRANAQPEDVAERLLSCLTPVAKREHERGVVVQKFEQLELTWAELRRDELLRLNALAHTNTQLDRIEFERARLQEIIPQYSEPMLASYNVVGGVNSHEREDIRQIYNSVYALKCRGVNPGHWGGVEQLVRAFYVDEKAEHPFRPGVMGYSRTFIVVPDDLTQQPRMVTTFVNGEPVEIEVYPPEPYPHELSPEDLHDEKLHRYQMVNWRQKEAKLVESGEKVDEVLKMNDDYPNGMQMLEVGGSDLNQPLSVAQEHDMVLKTHLPASMVTPTGEVQIRSKQDQHALVWAEAFARAELEEKHGDLTDEYDPEFFDSEPGESGNWWDS